MALNVETGLNEKNVYDKVSFFEMARFLKTQE